MPRRRLLIAGLGATALVATGLLSPLPATAATTTATVVGPSTCSTGFIGDDDVSAAKSPDGKVRGFVDFSAFGTSCGNRITFFEGSGTSWRTTTTPLVGRVVDVAADATGTYLLYVINEVGVPELAVAKRSTGGSFSRLAVVAPNPAGGTIVARDGGWYAVWSQYNSSTRRYDLYQAETLFGGGAEPGLFALPTPTTPKGSDTRPQLALGPDGQARLFWQRTVTGGTKDLLLSLGSSGAWNPAVRVAARVPISSNYPKLDLAVTSQRPVTTRTSTASGLDQVVVGATSGSSTVSSQPLTDEYGTSWNADIEASGTTAFAGYNVGDEPPGTVLTGTKNGSAAWTANTEPLGVPASIDTFGVGAFVYNGGGKYTALVYSGNRLYAVNR